MEPLSKQSGEVVPVSQPLQRTQRGVATRQLALTAEERSLGGDRVSAAEYEADLAANVHQLVERLKRKRYRARLVRRGNYIPKGNVRPLGLGGGQILMKAS